MFERVSKTTYSTGKLKFYIIRAYLPDVVLVVTVLILIHGLEFFKLAARGTSAKTQMNKQQQNIL